MSKERAKEKLVNYFQEIFKEVGVSLGSDSVSEIEEIVDDILYEVEDMINSHCNTCRSLPG